VHRSGNRLAFRHGLPPGRAPLTWFHAVFAATLLFGIFIVAPGVVYLGSWLEGQRILVDANASPRLARAEAALRDLDGCQIEYDRRALDGRKGPHYQDVLIVSPCEGKQMRRFAVPAHWNAAGYQRVPFRLERDSAREPWRIYSAHPPDALAKALEEAAPALRSKPQ
jgi:hypothetical protein